MQIHKPYFKWLTFDEDSESKSRSKLGKFKDKGQKSDISQTDPSKEDGEVPVADFQIDLQDDNVIEKHLLSKQD